jgi:hypothetical protein
MRVSEVLLTNILLLLHERNRCLSSLDPEESTSPHECKAFNFVGYYSFVLVILRSRSMRRIYIDIDDLDANHKNSTNTDASVGTDDEEAVLLIAPWMMVQLSPASRALVTLSSRLFFGPSSSSSPSRGKPSSSDYSRLVPQSPKRNEECIATINNHARQTGQRRIRCHYCSSRMITTPTRFMITVFLTLLLVGIFIWGSEIDKLQSVMANLALSIGVMHYESNIYSEHFRSFLKKDIRPKYFPFLIHGNTLLCPRLYREFIISGRPRIKAAIEMISTGLVMSQRDYTNLDLAGRKKTMRDLLPILIVNNDESGCNTTTHVDDYDFPRLTWSVPAFKHHMEWCQAVPIPSYEIWKDKEHTSEESWDDTFALESEQYPWNNKTNVALWRGTTTYNYNYTGIELNKIPRGRLVQISMKHPALIDAGFVRLNQQFENATFTKENAKILTDRMKFDDMMKYKAIIDIDGNDWSSRFPKLLCMNSVVIKVCVYVSSERIVFDGIKDSKVHLRRFNSM